MKVSYREKYWRLKATLTSELVENYRRAGRIAAEAREYALRMVGEGITLLSVAEAAEDLIRKRGARPAFPVNISINNFAAHYTPATNDAAAFKRGDVVKIDVGVHIAGYIGDTAKTVEVGTSLQRGMVAAAEAALNAAIEALRPGVKVGLLGGIIERNITSRGFKPIANLTGHGVDCYKLHSGVSVPNVAEGGGAALQAGMAVAIEPFATDGAGKVENAKVPGSIYRLVRARRGAGAAENALLEHIQAEYSTLPFAERWCSTFDKNAPQLLRKLLRMGIIAQYPVLRDAGGGIVTQAEHTVLITEGGVEVLT